MVHNEEDNPLDYEIDDYSPEYYWPPCDQDDATLGVMQEDGRRRDYSDNEGFIRYMIVLQGVLLILVVGVLFYTCHQLFYYYKAMKSDRKKESNWEEDDDVERSNLLEVNH